MRKTLAAATAGLVLAAVVLPTRAQTTSVRFATFNASLNRDSAGQLLADLANPGGGSLADATGRRILQAHNVAEIVQRVRADVLLVNEFDFDLAGTSTASSTPMPLGYASEAARLFQDNFLAAPHGNAVRGSTSALDYAWRFTPNTNTGLATGFDLNNNGVVAGGDDAFGFGNYAGQYGMTIYSRHEIVAVRSFQTFKWKDMPGNLLTADPVAGANNLANFYAPEEVDALRLSSKNHVDVTLRIDGRELHFLTAHPTPPTFDGPEDRNGKRNHDEIRFWADYIAGASYIYDDQGGTGGLAPGALFVIAGDYNADPNDGDSFKGVIDGRAYNAIGQLLDHPAVNTTRAPQSAGGTAAAGYPSNNGNANDGHAGDPALDTADFSDAAPGNLRVDYVLPSASLAITGAGIFWPVDPDTRVDNATGDAFDLVGTFRNPNLYANLASSDHRAVWVDVTLPAVPEPASWALMAGGAALLMAAARRRNRRGAPG